jgi:hypothetical protein
MNASESTLEVLMAAGWHPEREIETSPWLESLRREGWSTSDIGVDFLKSFGGLTLACVSSGPRVAERWILDPERACRELSSDWRTEYESRIGEKIMPVGLHGPMTLFVSESGGIYGAFDDFLVCFGKKVIEGLETLARGLDAPEVP